MIIKGIKKILKSDIPSAPQWFDQVLYLLNIFMDTTVTALRGNLSFQDNFLSQVKEVEFVHGVEQQVGCTLPTYGGFLVLKNPNVDSSDYGVDKWFVRQIKPGIFGVTIWFNGAGTITGNVKFAILG
jgi:hypothetical protein